jgi:hypothetical protein
MGVTVKSAGRGSFFFWFWRKSFFSVVARELLRYLCLLDVRFLLSFCTFFSSSFFALNTSFRRARMC